MSLPLYRIGARVHIHPYKDGPHNGESYEVDGWADWPGGIWYTMKQYPNDMPESCLSECNYESFEPDNRGFKRCSTCGYPSQ